MRYSKSEIMQGIHKGNLKIFGSKDHWGWNADSNGLVVYLNDSVVAGFTWEEFEVEGLTPSDVFASFKQ